MNKQLIIIKKLTELMKFFQMMKKDKYLIMVEKIIWRDMNKAKVIFKKVLMQELTFM
jgi:hypothetical protein